MPGPREQPSVMPRHNDTTLRTQWTAIAARLDPDRTARLHVALQAVRRTARANAERAYRAGAIGRATEDRIIAIYATHILRATGGRTPKLQPAPEPLTEPANPRPRAPPRSPPPPCSARPRFARFAKSSTHWQPRPNAAATRTGAAPSPPTPATGTAWPNTPPRPPPSSCPGRGPGSPSAPRTPRNRTPDPHRPTATHRQHAPARSYAGPDNSAGPRDAQAHRTNGRTRKPLDSRALIRAGATTCAERPHAEAAAQPGSRTRPQRPSDALRGRPGDGLSTSGRNTGKRPWAPLTRR